MRFRTWKKYYSNTPIEESNDDGFGDFIDYVKGGVTSGDVSSKKKEKSNDKKDTGEDSNNDSNSDDTDDNDNNQDSEDQDEEDANEEEENDEEESDGEDTKDTEDEEEEDDEEELSEIELLKQQNAQLLKLLEKVSIQREEPKKEVKQIDLGEEESFKKVAEVLGLEGDEQKVFLSFINTVVDRTEKRTVDKVLATTPDVVAKVVDDTNNLKSIKDKFYSDHPALNEVSDYVGQIATQVAKANPDYDVQKVLKVTAKKAYKALGIKRQKSKGDSNDESGKENQKKKSPAFAKSKGARKAPKKKTQLEQEIDAMLSID